MRRLDGLILDMRSHRQEMLDRFRREACLPWKACWRLPVAALTRTRASGWCVRNRTARAPIGCEDTTWPASDERALRCDRLACSARLRPPCAGWQPEPERARRAGAGRRDRTPAAIASRSAFGRTDLPLRHGPARAWRSGSDAGGPPRWSSTGARSPGAACHRVAASSDGATRCGRRLRRRHAAGEIVSSCVRE